MAPGHWIIDHIHTYIHTFWENCRLFYDLANLNAYSSISLDIYQKTVKSMHNSRSLVSGGYYIHPSHKKKKKDINNESKNGSILQNQIGLYFQMLGRGEILV